MAEKSISDQIIDNFIKNVSRTETLDKDRLDALRKVLFFDKVKKEDILKAIKEDDKDENP